MPAPSFRSHNIPKLHLVQKRYGNMIALAAEKAAGHILHPGQYPLPAAGKKSVERALYDVIMELPKRKRDDFTDKYKSLFNTSVAQRQQHYGELHRVDLHSTIPVAEQVKNIPPAADLKFNDAEIKQLEALLPPAQKRRMAGAKVPRQAVATQLDFIVDSITCNKTTEIGKDEIDLGAFATDAAGTAFNKDPFFVSKFKKGDTVPLGAKGNLFTFSLDAGSTGGTFPLTFVAGLFVNERDLMSNRELNRKLTIFLSILGAAIMIAGLLVMTLIPPAFWIGFAIFLAGGAIYIFGNDILPLYLLDDFGVPVTDTLILDTPPVPGDTVSKSIDLITEFLPGFRGLNYTANVRWVAR